jgi:hypothetical protein
VDRRVIAGDLYLESLKALGNSEEIVRERTALAESILKCPERVPVVPGFRIRVLKSPVHPHIPPMRLFYWVGEDAIHLLFLDLSEPPLQ